MVIYAHFQCHTRHILCLIGYQAVPKSLTHRFSCGFGPQPFEPFSVLPTRYTYQIEPILWLEKNPKAPLILS